MNHDCHVACDTTNASSALNFEQFATEAIRYSKPLMCCITTNQYCLVKTNDLSEQLH